MTCAATSLILTAICGAAGAAFIPLTPAAIPAWITYALITGTVAMGNWVIAHECGHGAFSRNKKLQDAVGFTLHSALLVPYFSWQRSHAVHHAHTNHIDAGETHVPEKVVLSEGGGTLAVRNKVEAALGARVGSAVCGAVQLAAHLLIGWPAYILAGNISCCALLICFIIILYRLCSSDVTACWLFYAIMSRQPYCWTIASATSSSSQIADTNVLILVLLLQVLLEGVSAA
jgi:fatty-acid desaturase